MPQEFQVLRCYQCSTFQVHQVKKAKKWSCKMCGEKQSVIKVFGRGTAADCRHHVQRLNNLRGEIEQANLGTWTESSTDPQQSTQVQVNEGSSPTVDRWSKFLTKEQEENIEEDDPIDDQFTTDMAEIKRRTQKRKRNQWDNYEDNAFKQSKYIYHKSRGHDRGRLSRENNSPEKLYMDVSHREDDTDQTENSYFIQNAGNKSLSQKRHQSSHSVALTEDYNKSDEQRSKFGRLENVGDLHSFYDEDQVGVFGEYRSGLTDDTFHGQDKIQRLNKDQRLKQDEIQHGILDIGQDRNRDQDCHNALTKGQRSKKDRIYQDGMKKNQTVSKWSKFQDTSDSSEDTDSLTENSELLNMSKSLQNEGLNESKTSRNVISLQSKTGRNTTKTIEDFSTKNGKLEELQNTGCLVTVNLTNSQKMNRQSSNRGCTGRVCTDERNSVWEEGNDDKVIRGDNSNSLAVLQNKQQCYRENQSEIAKSLKCVTGHQILCEPLVSYSKGTVSDHTSKLIVESSVSDVALENQRIGGMMSQKSTGLSSIFVTEEITDEDLTL